MINLRQATAEQGNNRLEALREQVARGDRLIAVEGDLATTKSPGSFTKMVLQVRPDLEARTEEMLLRTTSWRDIELAYRAYAPSLVVRGRPDHHPVDIVYAVGPGATENIFLLAHYALGIPGDALGFEFLSVWRSHLAKLGWPMMRRVLDDTSQVLLATSMLPQVDELITMSSWMHEIGHHAEPWRVVPEQDFLPQGLYGDALGELWTDALAVALHPAQREMAMWITTFRVFIFGLLRATDPVHGRLDDDNDALVGALLFKRLVDDGGLEPTKRGLRWVHDRVVNTYRRIVDDLLSLAALVGCHPAAERAARVEAWWASELPRDASARHVLPEHMQRMLIEQDDISTFPRFVAPVRAPIEALGLVR